MSGKKSLSGTVPSFLVRKYRGAFPLPFTLSAILPQASRSKVANLLDLLLPSGILPIRLKEPDLPSISQKPVCRQAGKSGPSSPYNYDTTTIQVLKCWEPRGSAFTWLQEEGLPVSVVGILDLARRKQQ